MGIQISNQRDINRAGWIAVQAERFVGMQGGRKADLRIFSLPGQRKTAALLDR